MNETHVNESWTCITRSPDQTMSVGKLLGAHAQAGDLIALRGELGAGKTQFTRGLATGMGMDPRTVASPTFVLIHEYPAATGRPSLVHMDAYRVSSLDELESVGWDPAAGGGELRQHAVLVVEWADRLGQTLGDDRVEILLEHLAEHERQITLVLHGSWGSRGKALLDALNRWQQSQAAAAQ